MLSLLIFVQFWKPPYRPEFVTTTTVSIGHKDEEKAGDDGSAAQREHDDDHVVQDKVAIEEQEDPATDGADKRTVSTQGGDYEEERAIIKKPSLLEGAIAWSPWVSIIVVVIM